MLRNMPHVNTEGAEATQTRVMPPQPQEQQDWSPHSVATSSRIDSPEISHSLVKSDVINAGGDKNAHLDTVNVVGVDAAGSTTITGERPVPRSGEYWTRASIDAQQSNNFPLAQCLAKEASQAALNTLAGNDGEMNDPL